MHQISKFSLCLSVYSKDFQQLPASKQMLYFKLGVGDTGGGQLLVWLGSVAPNCWSKLERAPVAYPTTSPLCGFFGF